MVSKFYLVPKDGMMAGYRAFLIHFVCACERVVYERNYANKR